MENKHQHYDLAQMQSLPLEVKIRMTKERIKEWYEHFDGNVYVSFSGGKDSTVLKHIVDSMYNDVPALFVNTGLEYPEIQKFVKDIKSGTYDCFNPDVEIVRPEMKFPEVIRNYGYPVISKEVADAVYYTRKNIEKGNFSTVRYEQFMGLHKDKEGNKSQYNKEKWAFLLEAPFETSKRCCDVMKKKPLKAYQKETGRKPFVATLASESRLRRTSWIQHGCNAFEKTNPSSQPMSFWTENDVLTYLLTYCIPYCSIYGQIVTTGREIEGLLETVPELKTTGCDRTGCIFCMFGCHLEKEPNRFQKLKETHPRQYEFCISGGEMVSGKLQPNKEGLGLGKVLDYIGVKY